MSPALAAVAIVVAAGAVIAVSAREARAGLIGLMVALGLGPFLADPLPSPAVLGARVVTGILVAYLLRAVVAATPPPRGERTERLELGSRLGWPAETALAVGAGFAGLAIVTTLAGLVPGGGEGSGGADLLLSLPALALAAGLASCAVAVTPAFLARSSLRAAIGLLVLAQGLVLTRTGLAGPPGELEQLGINALLLALGAGGALLTWLEGRREAGEGPADAGPGPRVAAPLDRPAAPAATRAPGR